MVLPPLLPLLMPLLLPPQLLPLLLLLCCRMCIMRKRTTLSLHAVPEVQGRFLWRRDSRCVCVGGVDLGFFPCRGLWFW